MSPQPQRGRFGGPAVHAVQPPDAAAVRRAERLSRVRGLLLGLALGDALTRSDVTRTDTTRSLLLGSSTTQLACATTEGLIRALVRADRTGTAATPVAVWSAYRRWARVQGIPVPRPIEPSGWLHDVPAMRERRGEAPEVTAALQRARDGVPRTAPPTSRGHHALSARLPLAAVAAPVEWIREVVLMTHGDGRAVHAAVVGVELVRAVLAAGSVADALRATRDPLLDDVRAGAPPECLAPDDAAVSALRGGAALAARCPGPASIFETLRAACDLPSPDAAGPLAGALLGAAHGAESLPARLVARLEFAWPVDALARDLVAQLEDRPGGDEHQEPADRHWRTRYPGD